jgi:hypothetical protein
MFVLFHGDVWKLLRREHYGDPTLWMIQAINTKSTWLRWVPATECSMLDPALNVLFMEKENEC